MSASVGDTMRVKVIAVDEQDRVKLSRRRLPWTRLAGDEEPAAE
jgi:predicted RNA-binding protein with RPS1 domain